MLQNANKRLEYMRIVERTFDQVTLTHNAELFILHDFDILLTHPVQKSLKLKTVLEDLKEMFGADPFNVQARCDRG